VPSKLQQQQLKALGANIRRERMRQEMTQERLAELVDLNIRTVQKIEAGATNVLITTALRFQKALRCSWNRLLPSD
jgi:transcriptional regulator with XRE-family HTH domain